MLESSTLGLMRRGLETRLRFGSCTHCLANWVKAMDCKSVTLK